MVRGDVVQTLVINEISPVCSDVGEVFRPSLLLYVYPKQIIFLEGYEKYTESSPSPSRLFMVSFFSFLSLLLFPCLKRHFLVVFLQKKKERKKGFQRRGTE